MKVLQMAALNEDRLEADIKSGVDALCSLMNEAALRGVTVSFNIDKNAEGRFEVQKLELIKKLR